MYTSIYIILAQLADSWLNNYFSLRKAAVKPVCHWKKSKAWMIHRTEGSVMHEPGSLDGHWVERGVAMTYFVNKGPKHWPLARCSAHFVDWLYRSTHDKLCWNFFRMKTGLEFLKGPRNMNLYLIMWSEPTVPSRFSITVSSFYYSVLYTATFA